MNIIFIKLYILNLGYVFSSINKAKFDTSIINSNFSNFKGDFYMKEIVPILYNMGLIWN